MHYVFPSVTGFCDCKRNGGDRVDADFGCNSHFHLDIQATIFSFFAIYEVNFTASSL